MSSFIRNSLAFAMATVFSCPALAAWSPTMDTPRALQGDRVIEEHTWTSTATDSDIADVTGCRAVDARFDPSTGDASTDAEVVFRDCATSTSDVTTCRILNFVPVSETDWYPLNVSSGYLIADAQAGTAGGDTAKVEYRCDEDEAYADLGGTFYSSKYDDSSSTTCGIEEAIAAATAVGGGVVELPAGTCAIDQDNQAASVSVTVDANVILRGQGKDVTEIQCQNISDDGVVTRGDGACVLLDGNDASLRDLTVSTNDTDVDGEFSLVGVGFNNYTNFNTLINVDIAGGTASKVNPRPICLLIRDALLGEVYGGQFKLCDYAMMIDTDDQSSNAPNAWKVYGTRFDNSTAGLYVDKSGTGTACTSVYLYGVAIEADVGESGFAGIDQNAGFCHVYAFGGHYETAAGTIAVQMNDGNFHGVGVNFIGGGTAIKRNTSADADGAPDRCISCDFATAVADYSVGTLIVDGPIGWETPTVSGTGAVYVTGSEEETLKTFCARLENVDGSDDITYMSFGQDVTLRNAWAHCDGTCDTEADFTLETVQVGTGGPTVDAVTAAGGAIDAEDFVTGDTKTALSGAGASVTALDQIRVDATTPTPATDEYVLCVEYSVDAP